jgi:hypothetical protein
MSTENRFDYAVVCFGSDNGIMLSAEDAAKAFAILSKGTYVTYGWGDSAYKFPKESRGRDGLKLVALDTVAVSKMMLEDD